MSLFSSREIRDKACGREASAEGAGVPCFQVQGHCVSRQSPVGCTLPSKGASGHNILPQQLSSEMALFVSAFLFNLTRIKARSPAAD